MDEMTYKAYTSGNGERIKTNLEWLSENVPRERVVIRLPLIPGYNNEEMRQQSRNELEDLGFSSFDEFDYVLRR